MNIKVFSCGPMSANCYIVEEESDAVIIDPGYLEKGIVDYIAENPGKIKKILLTHGHFDHFFGVEYVQKHTGAKVFIGKADEVCLTDDRCNLSTGFHSLYGETPKNINAETVNDGDVISEGKMEFKVINTPGHSPGSVCYYADGVIFSGDTLFNGSIGRTDFYRSDMNDMRNSLQKLKNLPDNVKVFPGHNDGTTIGAEKASNIYLIL